MVKIDSMFYVTSRKRIIKKRPLKFYCDGWLAVYIHKIKILHRLVAKTIDEDIWPNFVDIISGIEVKGYIFFQKIEK